MVVTAHPDDESPLAAGTIRHVVQSGGEVLLVCATLGERGRAHVADGISAEVLMDLRRAELVHAATLLGVAKLSILSFQDGSLQDHALELTDKLVVAAMEFSPDYVVGFGPDGFTGHADHVAAHEAAVRVSSVLGVPYAAFALPPEPLRSQLCDVLYRKRKFGSYVDGTEFQEPTHVVAVDKESKLAVIRCHKTQLAGLDPYRIFTEELAEHMLQYEYFRIGVV